MFNLLGGNYDNLQLAKITNFLDVENYSLSNFIISFIEFEKNFEETKLLNFYNIAGIRFQNIVANDALITSKINTMITEGWELAFVTSAVESDGGKGDSQGIFITRYIFKRNK